MNSKGQWLQLGLGIVVLFAVIVIYLFIYVASKNINDSLQLSESLSNESKQIIQANTDAYPNIFDGIGLLFILGLWLFCLYAGYQSVNNPLVAIIAFFVIISFSFVSMILSNTWAEIYENTPLAINFPIMNFFLNHYLIVILMIGFSSLVMVFVSMGSGDYV